MTPLSRLAPALLLLVAGAASARDRTALLEDSGPVPASDPYRHDRQLTTGRMEGFRRLYVDPQAWPDQLVPTVAAGEGAQTLVIENGSSAWVRIAIGDTEVGQIRPFDTARITGVKAGTYEVAFEHPNRRRWVESIATRP